MACQVQDAATWRLFSHGACGCLPIGQHLGAGEVRGYGTGLIGHVRYQGVSDAKYQPPLEASRNLLLAKRKDRRARGVGDLEPVEEVCSAVEEGVKRYLVKQAVRYDGDPVWTAHSLVGGCEERFDRGDKLLVE